jgi:hypothetical protein
VSLKKNESPRQVQVRYWALISLDVCDSGHHLGSSMQECLSWWSLSYVLADDCCVCNCFVLSGIYYSGLCGEGTVISIVSSQ